MANNHFSWRLGALCAASLVVLAGCGGGSDGDTPPPNPGPPAPGAAIAARLLTGQLNAAGANCQQVDGAAANARFGYLISATVKNRALYLTESAETCSASANGLTPNPRIRKLENGSVSTYLSLPQNLPGNMAAGASSALPLYPGGVQIADSGDAWVAGFVAARSYEQYVVSAANAVPDIRGSGYQFAPGFYRYRADGSAQNVPVALEAGTFVADNQPAPAVVDGQGAAAQFYAPHHLEVDGNGLAYVIDNFRIRTIDANNNVKTLDLTERYGIRPKDPDYGLRATALNVDLNGNVHALLDEISSVTWLNLATGKHVSFETPHGGDFVAGGEQLNHSIAAVGDALVVGNRIGHLFSVSGDGVVKQITGKEGVPTDENPAPLQDITRAQLPAVQHLEYDADGTLYVVLPSGVLAVDGFGQALANWASQ